MPLSFSINSEYGNTRYEVVEGSLTDLNVAFDASTTPSNGDHWGLEFHKSNDVVDVHFIAQWGTAGSNVSGLEFDFPEDFLPYEENNETVYPELYPLVTLDEDEYEVTETEPLYVLHTHAIFIDSSNNLTTCHARLIRDNGTLKFRIDAGSGVALKRVQAHFKYLKSTPLISF